MHLVHDPATPAAPQIGFDQFLAVDIRVGTVIAVEPFPEARKPALKLTVDFGEGIGSKRASAQITQNYKADELIGRQVAAVVNFPPRQIGKSCRKCWCWVFRTSRAMSRCLRRTSACRTAGACSEGFRVPHGFMLITQCSLLQNSVIGRQLGPALFFALPK
jgi:tRNA-binding protein